MPRAQVPSNRHRTDTEKLGVDKKLHLVSHKAVESWQIYAAIWLIRRLDGSDELGLLELVGGRSTHSCRHHPDRTSSVR